MKKTGILIFFPLALFLSGCQKSTTEVTEKYELPEGLKDCSIYTLRSSSVNVLNVVRCPHSDVSIKSSKKNSVVLEDRTEKKG